MRYQGKVERMDVEPHRFNAFAQFGDVPVVTLSTHIDTVPPYFASREDEEHVWGRGSCDAKGIIAAMVAAAERLLAAGTWNLGLLFVVGEEKDSLGSLAAAKSPRGSKYLINGEPTENLLAVGSKGALRFELTACGKLAHSAYPELGASAIEKLLNQYSAKVPNVYSIDEMLADMSTIYQRYLTQEDVDAAIAFYSSTAGQDLLNAEPKIAREALPMIQQRSQAKGDALTAEMKKDLIAIRQ